MRRPEPDEIHVRLTVPLTRVGVGPLSFDPLAEFLGVSLHELLESLLDGVPYVRRSLTGASVEVFPLSLPAGDGAFVPLGALGELGFTNDDGLLAITTPAVMARWLTLQVGELIVRGPERRGAVDGRSQVVDAWVCLRPGARTAIPLGLFGEMGLEAV